MLSILYYVQAKGEVSSTLHRRDEQLPLPMLVSDSSPLLSPGVAYDFDNDGVPEFFIKVVLRDAERGDVVHGFLNTFDGSRVGEYAPARGLPVDELVDVDRDGRLDLILAHALSGEPVFKRCALPRNNYGYLRHLAHALPDGRFSLDDPEAVAFARKECPQPPPSRLPSPRQPADMLQAVRCMRLWGVEPEQLQVRVELACNKTVAGNPCAGECGALRNHLFHYVRFTPPLTLHP